VAPQSVLAIGAHPSDVEYYAAAALAGFVQEGARVVLFVCSDGACGPGGGPELASERRREAERACAVLGASELIWYGADEEDGPVERTLLRRLVREIRRNRPELVLTHDPKTLWRRSGPLVRLGHSGHRAVGHAALEAIHPRAEFPHFHRDLRGEGLDPWLVRELWLFDTDEADHFVDAGTTWSLKEAALACHVSQLATRLVEDALAEGEAFRVPAGTRAEAFRRLCLL
jgi:LmbE family N-acetylglucosaminyl deacetylase